MLCADFYRIPGSYDPRLKNGVCILVKCEGKILSRALNAWWL